MKTRSLLFATTIAATLLAGCSGEDKSSDKDEAKESAVITKKEVTSAALAFADAVRKGNEKALLKLAGYSLKEAIEEGMVPFEEYEFETEDGKPEGWLWVNNLVALSIDGENRQIMMPSFLGKDGKWVTPQFPRECTDYPAGIPEKTDLAELKEKAAAAVKKSFEQGAPKGAKMKVVDSFPVAEFHFAGRAILFLVPDKSGKKWVAVENTDIRNFLGKLSED